MREFTELTQASKEELKNAKGINALPVCGQTAVATNAIIGLVYSEIKKELEGLHQQKTLSKVLEEFDKEFIENEDGSISQAEPGKESWKCGKEPIKEFLVKYLKN